MSNIDFGYFNFKLVFDFECSSDDFDEIVEWLSVTYSYGDYELEYHYENKYGKITSYVVSLKFSEYEHAVVFKMKYT